MQGPGARARHPSADFRFRREDEMQAERFSPARRSFGRQCACAFVQRDAKSSGRLLGACHSFGNDAGAQHGFSWKQSLLIFRSLNAYQFISGAGTTVRIQSCTKTLYFLCTGPLHLLGCCQLRNLKLARMNSPRNRKPILQKDLFYSAMRTFLNSQLNVAHVVARSAGTLQVCNPAMCLLYNPVMLAAKSWHVPSSITEA